MSALSSFILTMMVVVVAVYGAGGALAQGSCPGNLVPNPGFESVSQCPTMYDQLALSGWFLATRGTSDLFNACAPCCQVSVPSSLFGYEWGVGPSNGYAGFVAYRRNNGEYREYIQNKLASPLLPNTIYEVSFYVSLADSCEWATSNIGVVFTKGKLFVNTIAALNLTPDVANTSGILSEKNGWTRVCGAFNSGAGGQDHITLGNLASDANTTLQHLSGNGSEGLAYYFIDDICVRVCTAAPTFASHPKSQTVSFCQGATFTADGGCGVFYQWYANCAGMDVPLSDNAGIFSGTKTSTLTVSPPGAISLDGCSVFVTATNQCGKTASDPATLTIAPRPVVTPPLLSVCPPEPASLSVAFDGTGYKYQWVRRSTPGVGRWSNVPRATGPVLDGDYPAFWHPTPDDCGAEYACVVSKVGCGSILSTTTIIECCDCTPPPTLMALWLPFDQVSGTPAITRNVVSYAPAGVLRPIGSGPNLYHGQLAGNSLFFDGFDDHVQVQHHQLVDIGEGDLTIDAWIFVEGAIGPIQTIVDKRLEQFGVTRGYHMFLRDNGLGRHELGFQLADGTHTNWVAPTLLPFGWNHVAVTVDRDDPAGGTFYLNGAAINTFNPTIRSGSLSNTMPFTVGARSTAPSGFFLGIIDEVELFHRALGPHEIAAIYNANGMGKCKQFVQAYGPTIFCAGHSTTIGAYLFNFTVAADTFTGSFDQLGCPFAPPNLPVAASATVAPWGWLPIWVTADPALGMVLNDTACYTASFAASGPSTSADGQIVYRPDISCLGDLSIIVLPMGDTAHVALAFGNEGIDSGQFAYRVEAIGPDGLPSASLSIDNADPGQALEGEALVPIGEMFELSVAVSFVGVDALGVTTLLLSTDTDFDGNFEPAVAAALLCEVPQDDGCCPVDFDCNAVVDSRDILLFLGAWATNDARADWNGDGQINAQDLIAFLNDWTTGC